MAKPAIDKIGRIYEREDGVTVVDGWTFCVLDPENTYVPQTPQETLALLMGHSPEPDPDDCWSVEELREIAAQEAVLSLLPIVGER